MKDVRQMSVKRSVKPASILIGVSTIIGLYAPPVSAEAPNYSQEDSFHPEYSLLDAAEWNEESRDESVQFQESVSESSSQKEVYSEQFHRSEEYSHVEKDTDCECDKCGCEKKVLAAAQAQPAPPAGAPAQPRPAAPAQPPAGRGGDLVASGPVDAGQNMVSRTQQIQTAIAGSTLLTLAVALFIVSSYRYGIFRNK